MLMRSYNAYMQHAGSSNISVCTVRSLQLLVLLCRLTVAAASTTIQAAAPH
jgi:hypothetical protein